MERLVRVLIVDDSAYVRKVVKQIFARSPFIEVVGTARDGQEALELVEELNPDVITLDLVMPNLDGIGFLQAQMARRAIPVIILSIAGDSSELTLKALEAGAVEFVQKPTALATEKIFEISDELIEKVKAIAALPIAKLVERPTNLTDPQPLLKPSGKKQVDIVVLGISTGGPQALRYLVPLLPAELSVPIAIVMHMPIGYTELYARNLNDLSHLKVVEAHSGAELMAGYVYLAPAGRHLSFLRKADGRVVTHLDSRPFDTLHRPSVDVLFQSAAEIYLDRVLGVVMTGMGSDGKHGAAWIKSQGGLIFTEAEESCVVYGMPGSVVEAGLSDGSYSLTQMAKAILEVI